MSDPIKEEEELVKRMSPEERAAFERFRAPYDAIKERGLLAIKNFFVFVPSALILIAFAGLLEGLKTELASDTWRLGNPVETVMSLGDTKPFSALLAFTLLLRGIDILGLVRAGEFLPDAIEALYVVAFSILGFVVGTGLVQLIMFQRLNLLLVGLLQTVVAFVTLVLIDLLLIRLKGPVSDRSLRLVTAATFIVMACVTLYWQ